MINANFGITSEVQATYAYPIRFDYQRLIPYDIVHKRGLHALPHSRL